MSSELLDLAEQALADGNKEKAREYFNQYETLNPEPVQEETPTVETEKNPEGYTFTQHLLEVPEALGRAVGGSVNKTSEYVDYLLPDAPSLGGLQEINEDTSEELTAYITEKGTRLFSAFGTESYYLNPTDWVALKQQNAKGILKADFGFPDNFDEDGKPVLETATGNIVEPVARFIAGFVGVNKFLAPLKIGKYKQMVVAGGVGEFLAFGGDEKNLANIANDFGFSNEMTEYLATDINNTETENRLRTAAIGVGFGLTIDAFIAAVRLGKALMKADEAAEAGDADKAAEVLEEARKLSEELDKLAASDAPIITDDAGNTVVVKSDSEALDDFNTLDAADQAPAPKTTDAPAPKASLTKTKVYHGTSESPESLGELVTDAGIGQRADTGIWVSSDKTHASTYASKEGHVAEIDVDTADFAFVDFGGTGWDEKADFLTLDFKDGTEINVAGKDTNEIARIARENGATGVQFDNVVDLGFRGDAIPEAKLNEVMEEGTRQYVILDTKAIVKAADEAPTTDGVQGLPAVDADTVIDYNATSFKGNASFLHGSRDENLEFVDFDKIPNQDQRYLDNEFGNDALYLDFQDGVFAGSNTKPMAGYNAGDYVYKVDVDFDNALVVTPTNGGLEILDNLLKGVKDFNEKSRILKENGYDGLIIRDFGKDADELEALATKKFGKPELDEFGDPISMLESKHNAKLFSKKEAWIKKQKDKRRKGSFTNDFTYDQVIALNPKKATPERVGTTKFNTEKGFNDFIPDQAPAPKKPATQLPTLKQLEIATKKRRAELGSFRTNGKIDTVEPMEDIIARGHAFIEDLLRSASRSGDDLSTFVKSLNARLLKAPVEFSAKIGATENYLEALYKAQASVLKSTAYKANDPDAIAQAAEIREAVKEVYSVLKGLHADWGRTGLVIRDAEGTKSLSEIRLKTGEALDDVIDAKALDETLENDPVTFGSKTYNLAKRIFNPKNTAEKVSEYLQGSLLWQWETQATNIVGTGFKRILDEAANFGGAAVTGARAAYPTNFPFAKAINGGRNFNDAQRHFLHASRTTYGMLKHLHVSNKWGYETFMTGKNRIDPVFKVREEVAGGTDRAAIGAGDVDFRELRNLSWEEFSKMSPSDVFMNAAGNIIRVPFRGLGGFDEIFKVNYLRSRLYADISGDEVFKKQYADATPKEFDKIVEGEIDRIMNKLSADSKSADVGMEEFAQWKMRENTFTDPLGDIGKSLQTIINDYPILKVATSSFFVRVPTNVFKFNVRRTPLLSRFVKSSYAKEMWEGGKQSQDKIIFEYIAMSLIYAKLAEMAYQKVTLPDGRGGEIETYKFTSPYSTQELEDNANFLVTGIQPHGELVQQEDGTWRSYGTMRGDPFDIPLSVLTGFRDLNEAGFNDDAVDYLMSFTTAVILTASDKTTTRSFVDSVSALADPTENIGRYFENLGRASAPPLSKYFGTNPYMREIDGFGQALKSKIPVLAKGLPLKYDALSRPIPSKKTGFNSLLGAPYVSKYSEVDITSAAAMEFARMESKVSNLKPRLMKVIDLEADYFTLNGKTAFQRWHELINEQRTPDGLNLEDAVLDIISTPSMVDEWTHTTKLPKGSLQGSTEVMIRAVINDFRAQAQAKLFDEYKSTGLEYVFQKVSGNAEHALRQSTLDKVIEDEDDILELIKQYKSNN